MLQRDTTAFLSRIHPLDQLPPAEIEALCEDAALEYFRRGATILEQGGTPAQHLFVVKRGTVSMFLTADDGGELVVDYRGEGEYFGLLSVISDEPPRSNVRAEEDTIGLLIPKARLRGVLDAHPAVSDKLLKSYFLGLIDKTYEESRRRYSGLTNGYRVLFGTPVGEIVRRDPVATSGKTSIQNAARLMREHGISSLVVTNRAGAPVGIMTDRDLREKAVAEGRDLSQPVSAIMSSPIVQVEAHEPCSEALFKMMRHNIHHVLVTEAGRFRGMVTNHDFMVMQGSSPTLLVRKVLETVRLEHLEDARARLEATVAVLSREGARGPNISRVITEVARTLVQRTVTLAEQEHAAPSVVTVLLLGEAGRSELGLHQGPELALVCEAETGTGEYLQSLRERLEAVPVSGRLLTDPMPLPEWRDRLRRWVGGSGPAPAAAPGVFEMTAAAGDAAPFERLRRELVESAARQEEFRARLVAELVDAPPPLGFLGRLVVGTSGEQRHKLDLYDTGIRPLVDVVRIVALEKGIAVRSTRGRLRELGSRHGYVHADEIGNTLEYLQTLRIHQQLAQLEAGEPTDDLVDPETLANGERKSLKGAFQLVAKLHDSLARRYGVPSQER